MATEEGNLGDGGDIIGANEIVVDEEAPSVRAIIDATDLVGKAKLRAVRDDVNVALDHQINEKVVRDALHHPFTSINTPEEVEEYLAFVNALYFVLPEDERAELAKDPISFVSQKFVFRGLLTAKFKQLLKDKVYKTQSGQLGTGRGVFFSNSPLSAFTYQERAVIAVVDREKLVLMDKGKIMDTSSDEFKTFMKEYWNSLSPEEKIRVKWTTEEIVDTSQPTRSHNPSDRNVTVRREQPIEVTDSFLIYENGSVKVAKPDELDENGEIVRQSS